MNSHYLGKHIEAIGSVADQGEEGEEEDLEQEQGKLRAVDDPDSSVQSGEGYI